MKFVTLLPFLLTISKSDNALYWNPFDPVIRHIRNETDKMQSYVDKQTTIANNFIDDQMEKLQEFVQEQKDKVDSAVNSSYDEVNKVKETVNKYMDEQQKYISEEISNYVQGFKESGIDTTESSLNTNDKTSRTEYSELSLSVPSIITKNGYICETHSIISQGYILNIHRIPRSKNKGAVSSKTILLQHGIFASSADWILNGPEKGLAYVLADAGYDVWMTNIRGNKYSRQHAWLKPDTKEYWNFSWHDVALHDVPAIIDYITDIKGSGTKITYIGHSMGTTILFAMLTLRPEYNHILTSAFALAPVVFMSNIKSPLKSLAPLASNVAYMEMLYGSHEFLPRHSVFGKLYSSCDINNNNLSVCKSIVFYICGNDEKQFNKTLLPVFINNLGTGTSWKTVVHFAQDISSGGRFQQFDYGYYKNMKNYGSAQPPEYDLSKISLPIKLFWSQNDYLSSEEDVRKLHEKLPESTEMHKIPYPEFNHLDYLWAVDANELLNNKILALLEKNYRRDSRLFSFNFGFGK